MTRDRDLTRLPDWHHRLVTYLAGAARTPFAPGAHDCALFTAGAIHAMTGTDLAAEFRGHYRTLAGGRRVLRRAGYADHVALAAALLPEIAVSWARPGDIAAVPSADGPALGVVQGGSVYVIGPAGIGLVPLRDATRAFRVE